jgi:hypothetical protein
MPEGSPAGGIKEVGSGILLWNSGVVSDTGALVV